MIPPDAVPEHVRFLIVGQPTEAYEKYPFWLKDCSQGVSCWVVKGIQEKDILQLLADQIDLSPDQLEATVRLVHEVAKGNTLAAIFAIEEAKGVDSVEDLQSKLENRRLSDGVSAYYEKIWSAAVSRLEEKYLFVGFRLAGCLSLTKERLTGQDLAKIFAGVLHITSADWTEALRALRPLVIEEANGFRVTHNDVRVHLMKLVHSHPERLREVASLIADFYWKDAAKATARHANLFDLLRTSNRHSDQARVFTPEYVMEGFALSRPMRELHEQCQQALIHVADTEDWNCVHTLSCAATSLVQLHKSVDWMDRNFEYTPDVPPLLFSEGRVPNPDSWTVDMVYNTMLDAYRLVNAGKLPRAHGLMRRWFFGITPIDLITILKNGIFDEVFDDLRINHTFEQLVRLWGQVSQHTGMFWLGGKETHQTDDNVRKEIWSHFFDGYLREALEIGGARRWMRSMNEILYFRVNEMEDHLMRLANQRRWIEIAFTLKTLRGERDHLPKTFQIKAAALCLLVGRNDISNFWVQPLVNDGYECLDKIGLSDHLQEYTFLFCMVSFVLGWTQPHRENGGIAEEGVRFYFQRRKSDRQRAHLSALLHGSALAGKWFGTLRRRGTDAAHHIVTVEEVDLVLEALVRKKRNYGEMVNYPDDSLKAIVEVLIECSMQIGGTADAKVYEFIKDYCESFPVDYMLEIGWRYLWDRGDEDLLEQWFLHWCGPKGEAWHDELAQRVDVVITLSNLAEEIGLDLEAEQARKLLKWGMIGYSGHKEYVLDNPCEWYKELAKIDAGIWENEGKLLLEICQEASSVGDNRSAIFVEAIVAGSVARSGTSAMWRLFNAQNMEDPILEDYYMLFDGVISALETIEVTEKDLLSIWSFGVGVLNWHEGRDRCYLGDLKKAITFAASRSNIGSLDEKLETLGSAEYHANGNRDRYRIPARWFEDHDSHMMADPATTEFCNSLKEMPIESAIDRLVVFNDQDGNLWRGIYLVANRLKTEKPTGYPKHLQRLVELLLTSQHPPYRWTGDRVHLAYQALVPLVRDRVRMDLLKKTIADLDFEKDERIWLDSAAENLDLLCRFRASVSGAEDLRAGLKRHLSLHEMWIHGNGFLPDMKQIDLPEVEQLESLPASWSQFAVRYLLQLLKSNNLTRIGTAMQGIWSLTQVSPEDLSYIVEQWDRLSPSVKERVLLLAERAVISTSSVYDQFSEVVRTCYNGVDLRLKLQSWAILQAVERQTGEECPRWEFHSHPEDGTLSNIIPADRGVLQVPSIQRGLARELQGDDIIRSVLYRLSVVTNDNLKDVERKYVTYSNTNPPYLNEVEEIKIRSGQMSVRNSPQRDRLMKVLYYEFCKGRWETVPTVALAQALAASDEPFVLLQSPPPAIDAESWTIDHQLNELSKNEKQTMEQMTPHIYAGLSDDEFVVGAVLHSYSRSTDVEIICDTVLKNSGTEVVNEEMTTINGRTFALYHGDRFDPEDVNNSVLRMTFKAGGIGEFNNQSMLCYPSLMWNEIFGWYPSEDNPLVWLKDGEPVVRFEFFHGRVRDIVHEPLHRQPFIQRWVCSRQALENASTEVGLTISTVTFVNVRSAR